MPVVATRLIQNDYSLMPDRVVLAMIDEAKELWLATALEGIPIPEPTGVTSS